MVGDGLNKSGTGALLKGAVLFLILIGLGASSAMSVPSFARKYQTSCATCHYAYPKLNYFGKAFRNNGFRYPEKTDQDVTKEKPVSLGAEGYKKLWPKALWPADIAGTVPVGLRAILRANDFKNDDENRTFEFPHEVEILAGGTIGDTFSYFGEIELENEDNQNEIGMDFALQYDPKPSLHVRLGSLSVHPVPDHLRLTAAHYSPYDTRNTPGSRTLTAPNPNPLGPPTLSISSSTDEDRWRFREGQPGVEIWGAHNGPGGSGGLTWAAGVVNGQGLNDSNDSKDVYARLGYKFGGYGELGGGEMSHTSEHAHSHMRDDSFRIGGFVYRGSSTNRYEGSALAVGDPTVTTGLEEVSAETTIDNDFHLYGAEFDWWFRDLNLFGMYLRQNDDDPRGTGEEIDTDAWFAEANYVFYPWLIGVLRYGETDIDLGFPTSTDPDPQRFLVPAVVFMARANVKFTVEAQVRLDDAGKADDRYILGIDFGL